MCIYTLKRCTLPTVQTPKSAVDAPLQQHHGVIHRYYYNSTALAYKHKKMPAIIADNRLPIYKV